MLPLLLAGLLGLSISWERVVTGCGGALLVQPELVTYDVVYRERAMVVRADPDCPPDGDGQPQACMTWVGDGLWTTLDTRLVVDGQPGPPLGAVYVVTGEVIARNAAGGSDTCP